LDRTIAAKILLAAARDVGRSAQRGQTESDASDLQAGGSESTQRDHERAAVFVFHFC
jgi:hypothetical protein